VGDCDSDEKGECENGWNLSKGECENGWNLSKGECENGWNLSTFFYPLTIIRIWFGGVLAAFSSLFIFSHLVRFGLNLLSFQNTVPKDFCVEDHSRLNG
jgi:hypothetical protein